VPETRPNFTRPVHTRISPLQRNSNFVFATLCARLYAFGPSDLIKAAEEMEMTRRDFRRAWHPGDLVRKGTLGRPQSDEYLRCIPLLRSECFTPEHSNSNVSPSDADERFSTWDPVGRNPVGIPRGYYDDSCTVKHTSPTIKSVFERLSINADKYHWPYWIDPDRPCRTTGSHPGYPSSIEHFLHTAYLQHLVYTAYFHVVYNGPGDRGQAPSIVLPLGHLLVTAPNLRQHDPNQLGADELGDIIADGDADADAEMLDYDDQCQRCVPTWFSVVVDLGHVDKPLWLLRDLLSVNWEPKTPENYFGGECYPEEEDVTLSNRRQRCTLHR
jgi:hypothetical protein